MAGTKQEVLGVSVQTGTAVGSIAAAVGVWFAHDQWKQTSAARPGTG
jgi:hypothetical protein